LRALAKPKAALVDLIGMRLSTRILAGFGILLCLMLVLVLYQIYAIGRLQALNEELAGADQRFALASLDLIRDSHTLETSLEKQSKQPGPESAQALEEERSDFESGLNTLDESARSPDQKGEVTRLRQFWRALLADLDAAGSGGAPAERLTDNLDRLRTQTVSVYQAGIRAFAADAERSGRTGSLARAISWSVAGIVIVICVLTALLVFRSVELPLRQLLEGTGAIASGKYFYRLDTSRNDEFSQIARDFNTLTLRLSEVDQMKRSFVSHVSHELKAPMASIRETLLLLREGIPGPLTEKQQRLLELSLQSGSRLSAMVSNLLDASKIEAGVMEYDLQSHDLVPLIQTAIAGLGPAAVEKKLTVRTNTPGALYAECDKDRIVQVIGNLISNAIKFSPAGGEVEVTAEALSSIPSRMPESWRPNLSDLPPDSGLAFLSVSDSGPGIPDPLKELVFESFVQVRQGKTLPGMGLGLGLTICRTIIEAHGGAIWPEDGAGKGTVVRILLRGAKSGEQPRPR
jgi:signal transduction histidine kinase